MLWGGGIGWKWVVRNGAFRSVGSRGTLIFSPWLLSSISANRSADLNLSPDRLMAPLLLYLFRVALPAADNSRLSVNPSSSWLPLTYIIFLPTWNKCTDFSVNVPGDKSKKSLKRTFSIRLCVLHFWDSVATLAAVCQHREELKFRDLFFLFDFLFLHNTSFHLLCCTVIISVTHEKQKLNFSNTKPEEKKIKKFDWMRSAHCCHMQLFKAFHFLF